MKQPLDLGFREPHPAATIEFNIEFNIEIDGDRLIVAADQQRVYVGPWTPEGLIAAGQVITQKITRTVQRLTCSGSTGET